MRKNIFLLILILLFPMIVNAGGKSDDGVANATMIRATCVYRSTSQFREHNEFKTNYSYSEFDFAGIGYTAGGPSVSIRTYYNENLGNNIETFSINDYGQDYIINFNIDFGVKFTLNGFMTNKFMEYDTNEETLQQAIDDGEFCPSTVYKIYDDDKNKYEFMFCNDYNFEFGVDTCSLVDNYVKEEYPNAIISKQPLYLEEAISNNGQEDMTQTDIKDKYVEVEEEREDVCDPESESYDLEKCKALGELSDTVVDQANDQGISEQELIEYKKIQINPLEPNKEDCNSLLGSTTCSSGSNCEPAFYVQIVFTVMKYVAIVILIVMTMFDFLGAVSSSDDGAIKKALNKCITRLILCVLIFFAPVILEYLFTWMKVYTPSTCGIK